MIYNIKKYEGKNVEVRSPSGNYKGFLCKALITSSRPGEWFLMGHSKCRFVEGDIDHIMKSSKSYTVAVIVLKINKIPTMLN